MNTEVFPTQDPKYGIQDSRLVNMFTAEPIPHDEPIFIFRAKDKKMLFALKEYLMHCENEQHVTAIEQRISAIEDWQLRNIDLLKEPDSTYHT